MTEDARQPQHAVCVNCRTTAITSYDGGVTWTHVPSNDPRCWTHNTLVDRDAVATPWMQG